MPRSAHLEEVSDLGATKHPLILLRAEDCEDLFQLQGHNTETFATYMPVFKSLTESIQANEFENECLAEMRDALLPQLLSGQLDISDLDL